MTDVIRAYAAGATRYIGMLGSADDASDEDQQLITAWANDVDGAILDVGCGPGRWTSFLHELGAEITGIDPVDEFIVDARERCPGVAFETGWAEHLDAADASIGGVLSWYALIHTHPDDIDAALTEFARVLRPGGTLLISFFAGHDVVEFDHPVAPAWLWTVPELTSRLETAGFTVVTASGNTGSAPFTHGTIIAIRR